MVWGVFCLALLLGVSGCATTSEKSSQTIPQMSKEELKSRLQDPSLVILDVRRPQDWKQSGKKIKGAVQENPNKFENWYAGYPKAKTILLY
jgi:rhodanese-related sulfurtransferase